MTPEKIAIVGNSGAGKSTLAKALGESLGIRVYSVDKIYWLPGWNRQSQTRFTELHEGWMNTDSWIIEGVGYWEEMEHRITESDLTIFLDVPVPVCRERAELRISRERYETNPDITTGCVYGAVKDLQMEVIEQFELQLRPKLLRFLSRISSEKVRIIGSGSELGLGTMHLK